MRFIRWREELDYSLVKLAPNFTYKASYPNSLERQNVKLALKYLMRKQLLLLCYGNQNQIDTNGDHQFICLIIKMWLILNVKSLDKGIGKRDCDNDPIKDVNDASVI